MKISDEAVQAALDKCENVDWVQGLAGTGLCGRDIMRKAIIAALPHLQPVDVAAVRKQAFEEAAVSIECGCENPHCELDEAAEKIRALSGNETS